MPVIPDFVTPYPDVKDYHKQGVEVPGTRKPGQTGHFRNGIWGLKTLDSPGVPLTLTQIWDTGMKAGKDAPFLGHRPLISKNPLKFANHYVWETRGRVDERRRQVGSALHYLFSSGELGGGDFETVGSWLINRPEWQIVDFALHAYKKVGVSIYDTLGKDVVEYIINHAHLTIVFTSLDHIPTLLKLKPQVPTLKMLVSVDELSSESRAILTQWGNTQNVKIMDLPEFEALGREHLIEPMPATPDQMASICYTSGTTSMPKGVMLTHVNLAVSALANLTGLDPTQEGCLISYLPLAHIYQRVMEICMAAYGGRIGYFTGDPLRLIEDCQILKPTVFPSVPRVLNRIYQGAMAAGALPGLKGTLFRKAVQAKLEKLRTTGDNTHIFWDKLVFRKVQAVLGGNILMLISGSAPINPEVLDFLKIAFACDVVEGYGMTENGGVFTKCWPNDPSSAGTVGAPQACCEAKLVDVPAMNYTAADKPYPRGEICMRGPNRFVGYYKDEKNTKEAIDEEGWLHTGDVAMIDENGRIKIIDRVKNIMKLSQGEYVALEKIENAYTTSPALAQLYVHGDSLQPYLIAVVVADPIYLATLASQVLEIKVSPEDATVLEEACKDERIVKAYMDILDKEAKRNALKGFEAIKRIHLTIDPFTVEEGTLTPTFKIKRKDAANKFKSRLEALYALGEPKSGSSKL